MLKNISLFVSLGVMSKDSKDVKRDVLGVGTLSHKFQITIPKKVRDSKRFKAGDRIAFVAENDRVYLTKSSEV